MAKRRLVGCSCPDASLRIALIVTIMASMLQCMVTGFVVHTPFASQECSRPNLNRAPRIPRFWACADVRPESQPPWRHAVSTKEWDSDHIEQVANLRSSQDGSDPRMAYLTELDKAAKGISRFGLRAHAMRYAVLTSRTELPAELLQDSGIQLPLPDRESSQELQNMYDMVAMGMMTEEAYQDAVEQKRSAGWRCSLTLLPLLRLTFMAAAAAQAGNVVIGAVMLSFWGAMTVDVTLYSLPQDTDTTAYASNMVVRKECRGAGLGAALLAKAEAIGKEAGAKEATLHVHEANRVALRVYQRAGFVREEAPDQAAAHARSIQALIEADLSDPGHKLFKKALQ